MSGTIRTAPPGRNLLLLPALLLIAAVSASAQIEEPEVDSLSITGDPPVSESKLLDGTGLERGASLLRTTPGQVERAIEGNLESLGYLSPEVSVTWPEWDDPQGLVRIDVDAGPRSMLSGLVITGATLFAADSLATLYPSATGSPVTPSDTSSFRRAVLELYRSRGRVRADVDIMLGPMEGRGRDGDGAEVEQGYRSVRCAIEEGPRVVLGDVEVNGLETVRRVVVTRELLVSPGDSLNMELLRQSVSAIYRLGLFQDVRFEYTPAGEDSSVYDLDINVTESDYRRVDLGTGYVSPSALFGSARWTHPNIMGNNQRLTLDAYYLRYVGSYGGQRIEPTVIYEEPWFISTRWRWQLRLGYLYLETAGLEQRSYSATSTFGRSLTEHLDISLGYALEYEKYWEPEGEQVEPEDWETTSSISASATHDTRRPILDPSAGHWARVGTKLSGGPLGGRSFYRLEGEVRLFLPLTPSLVLAGRGRAGNAAPWGDGTSVPPDDRFFLGGGTTVRGYPYNRLGPKDSEGNPLGGQFELLGNFEVRTGVIGNLGVVVFLDWGGVWRDIRSIELDSSGLGTGIGLRYDTMFGPVRLDYGFGPTRSNSLRRGRVYFGLGHAF